jgi:hypothetical protein
MDAERFDTLIRTLHERRSRRGMLLGVASGLLVSLPILLGHEDTAAKKKRKHRKKKRKRPISEPTPPPPTPPGPTCSDGVKNGAETDIDCGGPDCPPCAAGKRCVGATDCTGGACLNQVCQPTCTDGVKNAKETDIDCGGPDCSRCANGKTCVDFMDCRSGRCGDANGIGTTCQSCAADGVCRDADANGGCLCDDGRGICSSDINPLPSGYAYKGSCDDCPAACGCMDFFEGVACFPPCGSPNLDCESP